MKHIIAESAMVGSDQIWQLQIKTLVFFPCPPLLRHVEVFCCAAPPVATWSGGALTAQFLSTPPIGVMDESVAFPGIAPVALKRYFGPSYAAAFFFAFPLLPSRFRSLSSSGSPHLISYY